MTLLVPNLPAVEIYSKAEIDLLLAGLGAGGGLGPTTPKMVGATQTYPVVLADNRLRMLASPDAGAVLTFDMLQFADAPADAIFSFTNSGPYAPQGEVVILLAPGDTGMGGVGYVGSPARYPINVQADVTLLLWKDAPGTTNWHWMTSQASRQVAQPGTIFTDKISVAASATFAPTGVTARLSEKLQSTISRQHVVFHGPFSSDVAQPRIVTFAIGYQQPGDPLPPPLILRTREYVNTDPNLMQHFHIEHQDEWIRTSNDPTLFNLYWKVRSLDNSIAGTAWLNRCAASPNPAGDVFARVVECPIA